MEIPVKPMCTRNCEEKTCVQKEQEIKKGEQTSWDKIYSYQTLPRKHAPRPDLETEKSEQFKNIEFRKNPQRKWLGIA